MHLCFCPGKMMNAGNGRETKREAQLYPTAAYLPTFVLSVLIIDLERVESGSMVSCSFDMVVFPALAININSIYHTENLRRTS